MVQEYGRYFGMKTAVLPRRHADRPGPLRRRAARLPRLRDAVRDDRHPYRIFGYKGKQVRDAIHCADLISRLRGVLPRAPLRARSTTSAAAGTPTARCSRRSPSREQITGKEMITDYVDDNRIGDHIWWIGDNGRFQAHYPEWKLIYDVPMILAGDLRGQRRRWVPPTMIDQRQEERPRRPGRRRRLRGGGRPDHRGRATTAGRYAVTALAVHGVMTGVARPDAPHRLNALRPGHPRRPAGPLGAQPAAPTPA